MASIQLPHLLPLLLLLQVVTSQTSYDYCELLVDVISYCEAATTNFDSLPVTKQASCYCGTALGTITWGPASFETLAAACASQYATLDVTIASDALVLEGFCTAGGVVVSPTSTASQTLIQSTAISGATATQQSSPNTLASATSTPTTRTPIASSPTSSSPGTVVSVVTVTTAPASTSSKNGARGVPCPAMNAGGLELAVGAVALGGYLWA